MALVPGEIVRLFRERFERAAAPDIYRAPGRVNLIGEHTDYNLGFVFPIALEMACYIAVEPAEHGKLRIFSRDYEAEYSIAAGEVANAKPQGTWSDYIVGVARELARAGVPVQSSDLFVASEVPVGSGLSSSAALEIASAFALLGSNKMAPLDIALLGRRTESEFVGVPVGIMDQYASVFGREGAAIQIDCRSLQHEYVELPSSVRILAVNSLVKHELGSSAYSQRVAECQAAVAAIQQSRPEVKSLRDVSPTLFEEVEARIPEVPRRRARHVVFENQRVLDFAAAARANELREMGRLFVASHRSMQYDYEITCAEIDFLVDTALELPGVYGARMTGGGFGGCTVNLIAPEAAEEFERDLSAAYQDRFGITPLFYDCAPAAGAGKISAEREAAV